MRLFPVALLLLLAWGALAVGGAPSWAGVSVAVFAVATGILGAMEGWSARPRTGLSHRPVVLALCLFVSAVGIQLVPLPQPLVARLSPARDSVDFERLLAAADLRDPDLVPARPAGSSRPLSIVPSRTWWGLGFAVASAVLLIGAAHGMTAVGLTGLTRAIMILAAVIALLGLRQLTTPSQAFYGLYVPMARATHSAPFVNHNHQAGWLVMVASLALGALVGEGARGTRAFPLGWRNRLLWFSSKEANVGLWFLGASVLTGIAILGTQSRSGTAAFVLTLLAFALWNGGRRLSRTQRQVAIGVLISILLIAVALMGPGVAERIARTSWLRMDGRVDVWVDTLRIVRDFWPTGTGFNTYGAAMVHYQVFSDGYRYIEAHNDYLQVAAEGGLLVGIPFLILIATLIREIRRRFQEDADDTRTYWLRVGAVSGSMAMAAQSLVDFTLQLPGPAAMFATLLAIAIHHPRPRAAARSHA